MRDTISMLTFLLLCIFYLAYLAKMLAQKRQGITTRVMIRGKKSRKAQKIGILLAVSTYLACAAQFCSCFFRERMGILPMPIALRVIGVMLVGAGDILFIAAFTTLKNSWRAGIDENQKTELVTDGIYRFSRNPAFAGFDLIYIGCVLAVGNVWMAVWGALSIVMMHFQILEEEKHLQKMFGQPYAEYKEKVRRYL